MEGEGVRFANIHTLHVWENGMKPIDATEMAFKNRMDPHGLMNPGKRTLNDVDPSQRGAGTSLPTSGWRHTQNE
jgi:hypothetical protein